MTSLTQSSEQAGGPKGIRLLLDLNWDRLVMLGLLVAGLLGAAYLGSLISGY